MNKALQRLFDIANQSEFRIIGLMSGTSLDGLDIALSKVSRKRIHLERFATVNYPKVIQDKLHQTRSKELVSLADISYLHTELAHFFANAILSSLEEWDITPNEIDLIASHGQTIYHDPESSTQNTLQIVDGDHIAQKTGIITLSDFRQKHVAAGGEGAPLAQYLDEFLFQDERRIRVALNLGGIANLAIIHPELDDSRSISTDVGPANTLINDAMREYFNQPFDEGGQIAKEGTPHSGLVKYLLLDPFFRKPFPKSTGQELFNLEWVKNLMKSHSIDLSTKDLISTLTELTIKSIVRSIDQLLGEREFDLIISGGGRYNTTLIDGLRRALQNAKLIQIEEFGITSDAKEAVLMSYLGFQVFAEQGLDIENKKIHLGKISLPD